jgi:hypothetical protein
MYIFEQNSTSCQNYNLSKAIITPAKLATPLVSAINSVVDKPDFFRSGT